MPIYFRIAMNVSDTIFPMIEIKEKVAVIWHSMRLLIFTCSTIYTIVVLMSFCSVILFCNKTFAEQFFFFSFLFVRSFSFLFNTIYYFGRFSYLMLSSTHAMLKLCIQWYVLYCKHPHTQTRKHTHTHARAQSSECCPEWVYQNWEIKEKKRLKSFSMQCCIHNAILEL